MEGGKCKEKRMAKQLSLIGRGDTRTNPPSHGRDYFRLYCIVTCILQLLMTDSQSRRSLVQNRTSFYTSFTKL